MSKNLCVIDIGTNAVKCKMFTDGNYYVPMNKFLSNQGNDNLNKDEVIKFISEFIAEAKEKNIDEKFIYIAATEAFRTSSNQQEIQDEIKRLFAKEIHMLSPKKEARFSVIGGLRSIRFKGNRPKQVLYVESGGGSTEVSLVELRNKHLRIISTFSLPLGSKRHLLEDDDEKTKSLINQKIKGMFKHCRRKGIKLDPSLRVVINSTAATRIIAQKHNQDKHNAFEISKNQNSVSLINFSRACENILANNDAEKIKQDYWLKDEVLDGFKGHVYILKQILESVKKETDAPFISNVPITTTIGGVKDGLMEEIVRSKNENPEDIEREIFNVGQENVSKPEKEKNRSDIGWINGYASFYKKRNDKYIIERKDNEGKLKISDGKNQITYTSATRADIAYDKTNHNNRLYEDMVLLAKEKNLNIKFDKDTGLEVKLRVYAACQKHNMKIKNFIYNPEMLEKVSPETKNIVLTSMQTGLPPTTKVQER